MPALYPGTDIIDLYNITDGLNTVNSGVRIGPTGLKDCQNIRYFPRGGFMWRQGYTTLGNSPGSAATGLFMGRFSNNTNYTFRTQGTAVEYMASLNGTWNTITNSVTLSAGQNNLFSFAILNDIVIGVNGIDNPIQISSAPLTTTVGALPASDIASFVFTHRGYMFYVCTDKAYFSTLNDPVTVGTNNFVRPGSKQGGNMVCGVDYAGKAFLWRRNGIYATEFQPTAVDSTGTLFPFITAPTPIVPNVGTQSKMAILKFTTPATHRTPGQELVFFLDQFGVPRLFDGSTTLSVGSSILSSRDSNITSLSNMDKTQLPYAWAVNDVVNNLIYVFMSSSSAAKGDTCWILDYNTAFSWARDSYYDRFSCGAILETTTGTFAPYFANFSGQVMTMNSGQTDNGVAITSYARTGDLWKQSPIVRGKWLYNEIRGTTGSETQDVTLDYYQDGDDSSSASGSITLFKQGQATWDNVTWDFFNWVYSGLTTKSSEINLECKTLGVKFSNSTSGNTASIEGCSLTFLPEGLKQES